MTFVPVRKFGDRTKKTEFEFIDRKPVVDRYVQKRLDRKAKEAEELKIKEALESKTKKIKNGKK